MNCNDALGNLVETARRRGEPDAVLRSHLNGCAACMERWESERVLTASLRVVRIEASTRRTPEAGREALMRQFAEQQSVSLRYGWAWMLAAAAMLLLGIGFIRHTPRASVQHAGASGNQAFGLSTEYAAENPAGYAEDGFIAVPFVPPLATGETVRIVHTELHPAALASLGVNVDPAWTTELPADLLVGEDGFPRAVRVSDAFSDGGSF